MFSDNTFWSNLVANLFSDLLASAALGTLLTWWAGKRLSQLERTRQRRAEKRVQLEKSVRYLEVLEDEIGSLTDQLTARFSAYDADGEFWTEEIWRISMPVWDILEPSGELPRLLSPHLLVSLARFYDTLRYGIQGRDEYMSSSRSVYDRQEFLLMGLDGFRLALQHGRELLGKLASEIQAIGTQLELA